MYTDKNYQTAKALREDFKAGKVIGVWQPGPFGSAVRDGAGVVEGPQYPQPHKFYIQVTVKDGVIVGVKK